MSMQTVGSIDAERRIKPLKHDIITKKRNRIKDPKGIATYRAWESSASIEGKAGPRNEDHWLPPP